MISQIGGKYVHATAVEQPPIPIRIALRPARAWPRLIGDAQLVVQNVGYDSFMNKIEDATPNPARKVIIAASLLWAAGQHAQPAPVGQAVRHACREGAGRRPRRAAASARGLLQGRERAVFDRSLQPACVVQFRTAFPDTVATTETGGDYMSQAAGTNSEISFSFQGRVDPAPQDLALQDSFFSGRKSAFVYNQQVTQLCYAVIPSAARRYGNPVVGVYQTMPGAL